jgi:hypothetical protein
LIESEKKSHLIRPRQESIQRWEQVSNKELSVLVTYSALRVTMSRTFTCRNLKNLIMLMNLRTILINLMELARLRTSRD